MKAVFSLLLTIATSIPAWAHPDHGLAGQHWHASDSWGFVAAAIFALLLWFKHDGK